MVLDTNVISEMMKPPPARSQAVFAWVKERSPRTLYTTAMSVAEIFGGIEVLPAGERKESLRAAAERVFAEAFPNRILPFDESAGRTYGRMLARNRRAELMVDPIDLQIAAIAKTRGMVIVTRDGDFKEFDIALVNPWQPA